MHRWVYFIGYGSMVKIGVSRKPRSRFQELASGSPVPLSALGIVRGDGALERELHQRWAAHHIRNEWFEAAPEIISFIEANARPMLSHSEERYYTGELSPRVEAKLAALRDANESIDRIIASPEFQDSARAHGGYLRTHWLKPRSLRLREAAAQEEGIRNLHRGGRV